MNQDPLVAPVGALARAFEPLHAEDSLQRAVSLVRGSALPLIPVSIQGRYIGVISERVLARALAEGKSPETVLETLVVEAPTISAGASGAEALRRFAEGIDLLVVLDSQGASVGILAPSELYPRVIPRPVPAMVGGMATPFGVYLTSGSVSGGVSKWALMGTGAFLISLMLLGDILTYYASAYLPEAEWAYRVMDAAPIAFFLIALRLAPLSGIHAAEHKVVHALERGELLTPEVVGRMPRVHPRCGTNIAVAATLFLTIFSLPWAPDQEVRLMVALLVTLFFWKWAGSAVQWAITTSPPNRKQLESGIRAAEDLLDNYAKSRQAHASPFVRIANSGILHVTLGSLLVVGLAHYLNAIFKGPFPW